MCKYILESDDGFKISYKKADSNLDNLVITRTNNGAKIASMSDAEFHKMAVANAIIACVDAGIILKEFVI